MSGRNDTPRKMQPMLILETLPGSFPLFDCQLQSIFKNGVSRKMNIGFTDWNQVEGSSLPKICQSVFRSANSCMVLPCCSYTAQKMALRAQRMTSPRILFHSADVMGAFSVWAASVRVN